MVAVVGLWHLGSVTAACLAARGQHVVGLDFDESRVRKLQHGKAPIFEPGLDALIQEGLSSGLLTFSSAPGEAVKDASLVWITYDTPVDEEDRANPAYVEECVIRLFPFLEDGTLVLLSSQVPIGTTAKLERAFRSSHPDTTVSFAYSPENLRLGQAVSAFMQPVRVVIGVRSEGERDRIAELFHPFSDNIIWMSVESAEMTKHALNAFLATSIVFANEIAALAERTGADAKEVERGLKSDPRIGEKAYLAPGAAFSGGTLARDVTFLRDLQTTFGNAESFFQAVLNSNESHQEWARGKILELIEDLEMRGEEAGSAGPIAGATIAVWGLTYKPGTDTLRRSLAVDLCRWLASQGARVRAHDPVVKTLPKDLAGIIEQSQEPLDAVDGASVLVIATEWPEYRDVPAEDLVGRMEQPIVIDPNRFLLKTLGSEDRIRYVAVGKAHS